jgi:hypothetical protein
VLVIDENVCWPLRAGGKVDAEADVPSARLTKSQRTCNNQHAVSARTRETRDPKAALQDSVIRDSLVAAAIATKDNGIMESLVAAAISTKITGIKDSLVSAAISKRNKKGQQQIDKNQIDKKQIDKKQIKRDCNRDVPGRIEKKKRKLAYLGRVQRTLDIAIQVYI